MKQRVAAILLHQNKILLVKRVKEHHPVYYTIPGGMVDTGETLEDALHREIHEETSLTITDVKLVRTIQLPHAEEFFYTATPQGDPYSATMIGPEKDFQQEGINAWYLEWVPVSEIHSYPLLPKEIHQYLIHISAQKKQTSLSAD